MAELIPESLRKRLKWLQNTAMASACFVQARLGHSSSYSFSDILPRTFGGVQKPQPQPSGAHKDISDLPTGDGRAGEAGLPSGHGWM